MFGVNILGCYTIQKNSQSRCFSGWKNGSRLLSLLFFNAQNDQIRGQYSPDIDQSRLSRRQENTNPMPLATFNFSFFVFLEAVFSVLPATSGWFRVYRSGFTVQIVLIPLTASGNLSSNPTRRDSPAPPWIIDPSRWFGEPDALSHQPSTPDRHSNASVRCPNAPNRHSNTPG